MCQCFVYVVARKGETKEAEESWLHTFAELRLGAVVYRPLLRSTLNKTKKTSTKKKRLAWPCEDFFHTTWKCIGCVTGGFWMTSMSARPCVAELRMLGEVLRMPLQAFRSSFGADFAKQKEMKEQGRAGTSV